MKRLFLMLLIMNNCGVLRADPMLVTIGLNENFKHRIDRLLDFMKYNQESLSFKKGVISGYALMGAGIVCLGIKKMLHDKHEKNASKQECIKGACLVGLGLLVATVSYKNIS